MKQRTGYAELIHLMVDDVWNRGHDDLVDDLVTDDYVNHGGLITDLVTGPEAIKVSIALYRSAFPLFHIEIEEIIADGEGVVLRWVAHRRRRRLDASPDTGRGLRGITRCRMQGGKIAESWTVWNTRAPFLQFGADGFVNDRRDAVKARKRAAD